VAEQPTSVEVGQLKIVPALWPEASDSVLARIGEEVELVAYSLSGEQQAVNSPPDLPVGNGRITIHASPGESLILRPTWRVAATPTNNYTTLFHLAQPGQPPLAQGDAPPLNGAYPTDRWATGEVIEDQYRLTIPAGLPAGRYPLWLGMYQSDTLTRLPLTVNGQQQPNDLYQLGEVEID
jgi:hypothetical protein